MRRLATALAGLVVTLASPAAAQRDAARADTARADTARADTAPASGGGERPAPLAAATVSVEPTSPDGDGFLVLFLSELARGRLAALGFAPRTVPPGEGPAARYGCLADPGCAAARAVEEQSALLVALRLEPATEDAPATLRWRLGPGLEGAAPREGAATGDDAALAAALREALDRLEPAALPCVLFAEGEPVALRLAGAPAALPAVVAPGARPAVVTAPGRAAWEGELSCAGGRLLRLRAE